MDDESTVQEYVDHGAELDEAQNAAFFRQEAQMGLPEETVDQLNNVINFSLFNSTR